MTVLGQNSWGKSGIRLVHLSRDGERYDLRDYEVTTTLTGETAEAYADGSNAKILTTDAQKNAVYGLAAESPPLVPEDFALRVATHFQQSQAPVSSAAVEITRYDWRRVSLGVGPAPHSFQGGESARRLARAEVDSAGARIGAGIAGLPLLSATASEFRGFPRDRFTIGHGTDNRILATELGADWRYTVTEADFDGLYKSVRELLVTAFASVYSRSIQFSMRSMADAVLSLHPEVESLTLRFPNLHHHLAETSAFGIENDYAVFLTSRDPHSLIEATFER